MDNLKVAVRIRPLVGTELDMGCRTCIERIPQVPQVTIGKGGQLFTYNYVFDEYEGQGKVYDKAVKSLIDNLFKGYNVTILAYGQTGSGKTFTMGTNYCGEEELGIIPRAVYDIFSRINGDIENEFKVTVSFIELYNESLYDLLLLKPREQSIVEMRETSSGVCIPGLTEIEVFSPEETLEKLKEGSQGRVVGATAMNAQSSRSHAIFTITVRIVVKDNTDNIVRSKFHLVDLAGSERSKKTGTTGDRFKEGVNINKGLLVLGTVISQLCEGKHSYINYRDSKLTRLLQDSLGGNSLTLMIACVSPADYNQDETLSTLRYADRARKIKNKPIINQDPQLAELLRLRKENEEFRLKMIGGEFSLCPKEHETLKDELANAMTKINELSKALAVALTQNSNMFEKTILIENAESSFKGKLNEFIKLLDQAMPEEDSQWEDIKIKMIELQVEQKKLEKEILNLDNSDGKYEDEEDMPDELIAKQRQDHILSQVKINSEIMALSKNLMWKEELLAKHAENSGQLVRQMQDASVESMEELKKQLNELQQEKEELLKQIKSQHAQNASAIVAENRRKRLQELETKVTVLMKKVSEQERIIKLKEKSEEKISKLKQEITTMKQLKVKLIQQMKSENDKFRTFKAQKDREVCHLKNQNIKKQNELKRMEQMHIKQQNVLRRKLEAAAAANKRIMAALEKQKVVRDKKSKGPFTEKIKDRMTEELELMESEYQAQRSLDCLLQDRAALTKELSVIKAALIDESISDEEKIKLKADAKQVELELELRSAEISDLQQKLIDIHQDEPSKNNWDMLQSMTDAKVAVSFLFNVASEKIKDNLNKSQLLMELLDQQTEADQQIEEYKKKLSDFENYHIKSLEKMEKECEEKVHIFMKFAAENLDNKDVPLSETFQTQTQELEKLRKRVLELEEENTKLSIHNKEVKTRVSRNLNETFSVEDGASVNDLNESEFYCDPRKDPDWREDTPIHKRLEVLKQRLRKRDSPKDEKCRCIDQCGENCQCSKTFSPCNESCSCDKITCITSLKRLKSVAEAATHDPSGKKNWIKQFNFFN